MLTEVADDEFGPGFIPDKVDGHAFLGVATAQGDVFVEERQLALVFEPIVITVHSDDGVADHRTVEIP